MSNNDAMLICLSFIASGTCADDSNQHPSMIFRFSENLYFGHFLKMSFELHTYCHEYNLNDITNWQYFGGGPLAEISASRALGHSIFICGADFFQVLIKSTIFGNKNNKCCF